MSWIYLVKIKTMHHIQPKNRHQMEFTSLEDTIEKDNAVRFIMGFNHDRLQHKTNPTQAFIQTLFFETKPAAKKIAIVKSEIISSQPILHAHFLKIHFTIKFFTT